MGGDDEHTREVPVDPTILEGLGGESQPWAEPEGATRDRSAQRDEAIRALRVVMETRLTPRQQEVVQLYFYEGKTQAEIAAILGVRQQVVSKQLFGAARRGRKVGGAIRKLRVLLEEQGITFGESEGED